jgi:hypothetical protein
MQSQNSRSEQKIYKCEYCGKKIPCEKGLGQKGLYYMFQHLCEETHFRKEIQDNGRLLECLWKVPPEIWSDLVQQKLYKVVS